MKPKTWVIGMILAVAATANAVTNDLSTALQKGLFEEEANRNLDAAIAAYQSLVGAFDKDRQIAATAVFRLGECYRKLGRTNEALGQYERIIREFSDQTELVKLSRVFVVPAKSRSVSSPILPGESLDVFVTEDPKLNNVYEVRQRGNIFIPAVGMVYVAGKDLAGAEQAIKDALAEGLIRNASVVVERHPDQTGKERSASVSVTDEEQQEILRIQAMVQNSPDLINAPSGSPPPLTPLCRAASKGQLRVAQFLLEHGADVNRDGPLRSAAAAGQKTMVELLVRHGADVNAADRDGWTALHAAAQKGFLSVTEALLVAKADPNIRDSGSATPLALAAKGGFVRVAAALLAAGADPNVASHLPPIRVSESRAEGRSLYGAPLHFAAVRGDAALTALLLTNHADVTVRNINGETPLDVAADLGKAEVVDLLLGAGADPNARASADAATPLHLAAAAGHQDVVKLLLEHGADPNARALVGKRGTTPLMQAASAGYDEVAALLLEHKADPNLYDENGQTALTLAIGNGRTSVVKTLLARGAEPNLHPARIDPPITLARTLEIVSALLQAKADPNAAPPDGRTALHRAAEAGDRDLVKLLLAANANVNVRMSSGLTPLHLAVAANHPDIVELLLAAKADPNARDNQDQTPLDLAKQVQASSSSGLLWPGSPPGVLRTIPVRLPPLPSVQGITSAGPNSKTQTGIADLLRQHGAQDNLPRFDRIEVCRPSSGFSETVFLKSTNAWNQFTLLEGVARHYGLLSDQRSGNFRGRRASSDTIWSDTALRFPDFKQLMIHRPAPDEKSWTTLRVNLADLLSSGDCSRDVALRWGDTVEIPEADHPVAEQWPGLTQEDVSTLVKCVSRTVTIGINGTNVAVELAPEYTGNDSPSGRRPGLGIPAISRAHLTTASFMLRSALDESKLIRSSSDLTRVKVTRRDPKTNKPNEWVLDCSNPNSAPDFWLRDGDVIEVPEK